METQGMEAMAEDAALARNDAPWLSAEAVAQAQRILRSHAQAFGRPLLVGLAADASPRQWAQALFSAGTVVLSHDGQDPGGDPGPRLTYANGTALRLWRRPWAELVGMPSRLTAEADARPDRARMLQQARAADALQGYCGVRIDSQGRRFQISDARLWTLRDGAGQPCGQAAAFNAWHWL
jgi:hypothetical protein